MSWIKMNEGLQDHPKVMAIADELGIDEIHVIGCLYVIWNWVDKHSENGEMRTVSVRLDSYVRTVGFCAAMEKVGWVEKKEGVLVFPRFSENNGKTAKSRALEARRSESNRGKQVKNKDVKESVRLQTYENTESVRLSTVPREEKNREEKNREIKREEKIELGSGLEVCEKIKSLRPTWGTRSFDAIEQNTIFENSDAFQSLDYKLLTEFFNANPNYASKSRKAFIEDIGSTASQLAMDWQSVKSQIAIDKKAKPKEAKPLEPWQLDQQIDRHQAELTALQNSQKNWHHVPNPKPGPGKAATVKVLKPGPKLWQERLENRISELKQKKACFYENEGGCGVGIKTIFKRSQRDI